MGMLLDLSRQSRASIAVEKLKRQATARSVLQPSHDDYGWVQEIYPHLDLLPPAKRHLDLWSWGQRVQKGIKPLTFVAVWPRASGKSATAEILTTYLGATNRRKYVWYVSATQDLADIHVENIASLLESPTFGIYYPLMAQRKVGKFGTPRGWRRNRLRCNNGFTVDALGVDVGARGRKVEEQRPDLIIIDDVDDPYGSPDKIIKTITQAILPAGAADVAVLCIQNLVRYDGFFGKMVNGQADYLNSKMLSGPWPAIENLQVEQQNGRYVIVGGQPTWSGQSIEVCQQIIDTVGISSFKRELQHEVGDNSGMFRDVQFRYVDKLPSFINIITVIDPAVTNNDNSDCHGIVIGAIDENYKIYPLWTFEDQTSPYESVKLAVQKSIEYNARSIYIETNQGGTTWDVVFNNVIKDLDVTHSFDFQHVRAGNASKIERAQVLLAAYEGGEIIHPPGQTNQLEQALGRFPTSPPYDLVDAWVWAVHKLQDSAHWLVA